MKSNNYDFLIKVLIIGDSGVGKTNLLLRLCDDSFNPSHLTTIGNTLQFYQSWIGIDFKIKTFEIKGKTIKMQIWDTAGQERFKTIVQTYYKGAQLIILTYSIDDRDSFYHIENWMGQIKKQARENVLLILVGNKADLGEKRQVKFSEGEGYKRFLKYLFKLALAKEKNIKFIETSAQSNYNVTDLFKTVGEDILEKIIDSPTNEDNKEDKNIILAPEKVSNDDDADYNSCC